MARDKKPPRAKRKSVRTTRASGKRKLAASKKPPKVAKTKAPARASKGSTSKPLVEGTRQFNLAGRPSREHLILVYGEQGPKMTWKQRAAAGVSAKQFQAVLAAKQSGR